MAFFIFLFLGFVLPAGLAIAQTVSIPETPEQASSLIPVLIDAISTGKWVIVASIVVLVLTLVFRQHILPKLKVGTGVLPWVTIAIAAVNGFAAHLIGGVELKEAAYFILISGGLASQIWSLGGKYIADYVAGALGKKIVE